jgi:hypothetical protein
LTVLYTFAGLGIATAALMILSLLYAFVVAPYEQRRALRKEIKRYEERQPELTIETGNGAPWDDPRHAPQPFQGSVLSGTSAQLLDLSKQANPDAIPANGYAKRFRIENVGPVKALQCFAYLVQPGAPNISMLWEQLGAAFYEQFWLLNPGEPAYLLLPGMSFTEVGLHDVEIRVFAENLSLPASMRCLIDIQPKTFPRIVPRDDGAMPPTFDQQTGVAGVPSDPHRSCHTLSSESRTRSGNDSGSGQ